MKGIREIRSRIKGIKSTAQITRAMQLVATSKMKRAQESVLNNRPYTLLLAEILDALVEHLEGVVTHPFFEKRPVKRRGILILGTDRGLCGALNQNLIRKLQSLDKSSIACIGVGRKVCQAVGRLGYPFLAEFKTHDPVTFQEARTIASFLTEQYNKKQIDAVDVLYPEFKNTLLQEPVLERLLPFANFHEELKKIHQRAGLKSSASEHDTRYFLLEPSPRALVHHLPEIFIGQTLYHLFLEAKASEHSSRMVAMKMATDNAQNLLSELELEKNKVRQAAITEEIQEIAASQRTLSED